MLLQNMSNNYESTPKHMDSLAEKPYQRNCKAFPEIVALIEFNQLDGIISDHSQFDNALSSKVGNSNIIHESL